MIKIQIVVNGDRLETLLGGDKIPPLSENSIAVRELERIKSKFMAMNYEPVVQTSTGDEHD